MIQSDIWFNPGSLDFISVHLLIRNANFCCKAYLQSKFRRLQGVPTKRKASTLQKLSKLGHSIEQTSRFVCALQHQFIDLLEKIVDDPYCKDHYLEQRSLIALVVKIPILIPRESAQ